MTYEELKDFLQVRMRMSHVYQPLMIRELLTVGGRDCREGRSSMGVQPDGDGL